MVYLDGVYTMSVYIKSFVFILSLGLVVATAHGQQPPAASGLAEGALLPPALKAPFTVVEAQQAKANWSRFLAKDVSYQENDGPEMTLIPPGEFFMGLKQSLHEILDDFSREGPGAFRASLSGKRVSISEPFFLSKHEVTVGQFRSFVKATGYITEREKGSSSGTPLPVDCGQGNASLKNTPFPKLGDKGPVTFVTWNDANAYCEWLSRVEGKKYRLPTQAEWEYACRAGAETRYSSGQDVESLVTVANVPNVKQRDWNRIDIGYGEQRLSMIYPGKPGRISIRQDKNNASTYFLVDSSVGSQGKTIVSNDSEIEDLFVVSKEGDINIGPSARVLVQPRKIDHPTFLSGRWYEGEEAYPIGVFRADILPGMEVRFRRTEGNWAEIEAEQFRAMCVTELLGTDKVRLINQDLNSVFRYRVGGKDFNLNFRDYTDVKFIKESTYRTYSSDGFHGLAPVGQFKPNAFGVYDMHGNVFEWCLDGFDLNYQTCPSVDPKGSPNHTSYAIRGACFL